jgi:ribosomal protein S18 acetylase RimI-like enzyme
MTRLERIRAAVAGWRPEIGSAYLTYFDVRAHAGREVVTDDRYELHEVVEPADPMIDLLPRWQRPLARRHIGNGSWYHLVATDRESGEKVGHVWLTVESTRGVANGVMNVRLAPDEVYVFDLYIHPEHRRAALGNAMAQWLVETFVVKGVRWGLTHVLHTNAVSVMWHHSFGFNWMQMYNYVRIGERIWWKIPLSDSPRFGPLSRRGRYSSDDPSDPFGGALLPQELI